MTCLVTESPSVIGVRFDDIIPIWGALFSKTSACTDSVKRSDVTRRKQGYIRFPFLYFIVLASSVKTKEVKVIEFHRTFELKTILKHL